MAAVPGAVVPGAAGKPIPARSAEAALAASALDRQGCPEAGHGVLPWPVFLGARRRCRRDCAGSPPTVEFPPAIAHPGEDAAFAASISDPVYEFCHEQESERRVSCEALYYWSDISGDRDMPRPDEVDFDAVPDIGRYLFLMATGNGRGHFMIQRAGAILDDASSAGEIAGRSVVDVFPAPLNQRVLECCESAVSARRPMVDSGILILENDTEVLYRMIMMPLSSDGTSVDHVLGAFSFRRPD